MLLQFTVSLEQFATFWTFNGSLEVSRRLMDALVMSVQIRLPIERLPTNFALKFSLVFM
jgi:hypothetical protein